MRGVERGAIREGDAVDDGVMRAEPGGAAAATRVFEHVGDGLREAITVAVVEAEAVEGLLPAPVVDDSRHGNASDGRRWGGGKSPGRRARMARTSAMASGVQHNDWARGVDVASCSSGLC